MGRDLEDSSSMVERTLKDAAETCEKHFVVLKENNRGVVMGNEGSLIIFFLLRLTDLQIISLCP